MLNPETNPLIEKQEKYGIAIQDDLNKSAYFLQHKDPKEWQTEAFKDGFTLRWLGTWVDKKAAALLQDTPQEAPVDTTEIMGKILEARGADFQIIDGAYPFNPEGTGQFIDGTLSNYSPNLQTTIALYRLYHTLPYTPETIGSSPESKKFMVLADPGLFSSFETSLLQNIFRGEHAWPQHDLKSVKTIFKELQEWGAKETAASASKNLTRNSLVGGGVAASGAGITTLALTWAMLKSLRRDRNGVLTRREFLRGLGGAGIFASLGLALTAFRGVAPEVAKATIRPLIEVSTGNPETVSQAIETINNPLFDLAYQNNVLTNFRSNKVFSTATLTALTEESPSLAVTFGNAHAVNFNDYNGESAQRIDNFESQLTEILNVFGSILEKSTLSQPKKDQLVVMLVESLALTQIMPLNRVDIDITETDQEKVIETLYKVFDINNVTSYNNLEVIAAFTRIVAKSKK